MATVLVGPKVQKPTHHLSLTNAKGQVIGLVAVNSKNEPDETAILCHPVERSSMKTSTGQSQYSDLKPPYTTIVQSDWSGGRASPKFENDVTKFFDSLRLNTGRAERVILQGRETYATGFRTDVCHLPGSMKLINLVGGRRCLARSCSVNPDFSATQIWIWVRRIGKPNAALNCKLKINDVGGGNIPGTTLKTITLAVADLEPLVSELCIFEFTAQALTHIDPTDYYWIEVYASASDDDANHWEVGCNQSTGTSLQSANGTTWITATGIDLYYRIVPVPTDGDGYYFYYKDVKYFVSKPADGSAAQLWMNGTRGAAISNAADKTKLNTTAPGWDINQLAGGVVILTGGTGSTEAQNWRNVVSNAVNTLTVDSPWLITHDTTTEFVVTGVDFWSEITGHGLTYPVTCVLVSSRDVVYFCQGDKATMRRMREYNNAGTWTRDFAADGSNKAVFLEEYKESDLMNLLASYVDSTVKKNIVSRTMTGILTYGSMVITGLMDTSRLLVGMKISGVGVGEGSVIASIDAPTQVTGSVNSTAMGSFTSSVTFKSTQNGRTVSGSATIYDLDTSKLFAGMTISGAGVGQNATIYTVDSATQITASCKSTASATISITFGQTYTGKLASGSMVISELPDTSPLVAGMAITGKEIGVGSVIATVDSLTQVTGTVNSIGSAQSTITFKQGSPDWGTNLSFEPSETIGDLWDKTTGLKRYVNESQDECVWILKEGIPWVWVGGSTDSYDRLRLEEFRSIASSKNGKATARLGVYLYYSVMDSVHRYYYPTQEDIGPTLGEGIPEGRQGPVVSMISYPGRLFAAIDAGDEGYSSILENTSGSAWHEVYRAPYGERIHCIDFQVIPGTSPDRLWIRQGNDMVWIPFPSETFDPFQDVDYPYTHEGALVMASVYAGLMDAWKNWHAIKANAANLIEDKTWLEADYRLDDEDEWHVLPDRFEDMPFAAVEFDKFGASSKKLDLRIRFYSTDTTQTPKLLALIIEAVSVAAPKFSLSFSVKMTVKDLQGNVEDLQPHERIQIMNTWSGTAQPLKLNANNPLYDGMNVFMQPLPSRATAIVQREDESDFTVSVVVQEA